MKKTMTLLLAGITIICGLNRALAADVTLTIESWRNDDLAIWQKKLIPVFEAKNPGIKIKFEPMAPTEYNAALNAKLDAGTAGDLITCRPFDQSLGLFQKGNLTDVTELKGIENFSAIAKAAWQTDDGKTTFCVPMASVIHGFMYNKKIFAALGITPPATREEFFAALDKIKADGAYVPIAMGTKDQWDTATMGYQNIGPNYWKGEEGRWALIRGEQKLTDPQWVAPFTELARWKPYLSAGFEAQSYPDSQNLFTLGRAAIYPTGSWEISPFKAQAEFEMGAFPPPVQKTGDTCYISDQSDIAIGANAKSNHLKETQKFLEWVTTTEFAELYSNALPGFFSLSSAKVKLSDPLAQEFMSWRDRCQSTIRAFTQILSRGIPNIDNDAWTVTANVINGTQTPAAAANQLQNGLNIWYKPTKSLVK